MAGTVTLQGHEVATFTLDVPLTTTSLEGRAGVTLKLDPVGPLMAQALRDMAEALDAPTEEGSTT